MEHMNTYTCKEVAEKFGYAVRYYRHLVREGKAPVMPIPGTTRYSRRVVDLIVDGYDQIEAHKAEAKV